MLVLLRPDSPVLRGTTLARYPRHVWWGVESFEGARAVERGRVVRVLSHVPLKPGREFRVLGRKGVCDTA
jgi:hypothetical protein